jgi:cellobiose-specific phosphotransferase system component IIA
MAKLRCRVAERLLMAYLKALGDSNQTYLDCLRKLQSGRTGTTQKELSNRNRQLQSAHEALQVHIEDHGCLASGHLPGASHRKR